MGSGARSGYSSFMCDILASYKNVTVQLVEVLDQGKQATKELVDEINMVRMRIKWCGFASNG